MHNQLVTLQRERTLEIASYDPFKFIVHSTAHHNFEEDLVPHDPFKVLKDYYLFTLMLFQTFIIFFISFKCEELYWSVNT